VYNMDVITHKALIRVQERGIQVSWELLPRGAAPLAGSAVRWSSTEVEDTLPAVLAGRASAVRFRGTAQFLSRRQTRHVWLIAVLGSALNVLLGALLLIATGRTALVQAEVERRTADLQREVEEHRLTEEALRQAKNMADAANR